MTTRIWNPEIAADPLAGDGYAEVDDSAVAQLRQSGWLLAAERDEHEARVAAHPSQNRPGDEDQAPGAGPRGAAKTDAAGSKPGGGKAGSAGSEGS